MHCKEELPLQMEVVLGQLLINARELKSVSMQVFSRDEVEPLQRKQEQLVSQLMEIDDACHAAYADGWASVDPSAWHKVKDQLQTFQDLNNSFINNLSVRKGLLQMEIQSVSKRPFNREVQQHDKKQGSGKP